MKLGQLLGGVLLGEHPLSHGRLVCVSFGRGRGAATAAAPTDSISRGHSTRRGGTVVTAATWVLSVWILRMVHPTVSARLPSRGDVILPNKSDDQPKVSGEARGKGVHVVRSKSV